MDELNLDLSSAAFAEATALQGAAALRGDTATAQRFADMMRIASAGPAKGVPEKFVQGLRVLRLDHWEEARDVLASLDRSQLPLVERPVALAILAHVTMRAGDAERGAQLTLDALREAEAIGADYPKEKLRFIRGMQGQALLNAGKADEAIAILQPLVASDDPNGLRGAHAYFIAVGYAVRGREDDAKPWLEIAAAEDSPFAKRAKKMLVALKEPRIDPASALAAAHKAASERGDLEEAEGLATMMRLLAEDRAKAKDG